LVALLIGFWVVSKTVEGTAKLEYVSIIGL
jgi:hypothetical protein